MKDLPDVLVATDNEVCESVRSNLDLFLEADGHHGGLDLLDARLLEPQVEAVVGQVPDLGVIPVVAHAHDGNLGAFHQLRSKQLDNNNRCSKLLWWAHT